MSTEKEELMARDLNKHIENIQTQAAEVAEAVNALNKIKQSESSRKAIGCIFVLILIGVCCVFIMTIPTIYKEYEAQQVLSNPDSIATLISNGGNKCSIKNNLKTMNIYCYECSILGPGESQTIDCPNNEDFGQCTSVTVIKNPGLPPELLKIDHLVCVH